MTVEPIDKLKIAPRFEIFINDTKIEDDIANKITNVEVSLDINACDEITITLHDYDKKLLESKAFAEKNIISVYMGYETDVEYVASGDIASWDVSFGRSSNPTIRVRAYDVLHKHMDFAKHNGMWRKKKDSWIANHLITDHLKLKKPVVDPTEGTTPRLQKKGVTDYKYLKRLALLNGHYMWAEYGEITKKWTVFWRSKEKIRSLQETQYSFIHNNDKFVSLLEFTPTFTTRGQVTDVEVLDADKQLKKINRTVVKEVNLGNDTIFLDDTPLQDELKDGASVVFTAFGRRIEVFAGKKFKNKFEAKKWAERYLRARGENFLSGEGKIIGTPSLRPREIHHLGGIGARFSGEWEFTKVRHVMSKDRPYETSFSARKVYDPTNPKSGPADVPLVERLFSTMIFRLPF